jgi:hypothetical protein
MSGKESMSYHEGQEVVAPGMGGDALNSSVIRPLLVGRPCRSDGSADSQTLTLPQGAKRC